MSITQFKLMQFLFIFHFIKHIFHFIKYEIKISSMMQFLFKQMDLSELDRFFLFLGFQFVEFGFIFNSIKDFSSLMLCDGSLWKNSIVFITPWNKVVSQVLMRSNHGPKMTVSLQIVHFFQWQSSKSMNDVSKDWFYRFNERKDDFQAFSTSQKSLSYFEKSWC
jgi:hypothetical protein